MNQATIDKLHRNPHYKSVEDKQYPDAVEKKEEEETVHIKTFGKVPAVHTIIPKHPTEPLKVVHRKKKKAIDN